jgi:DNA modification methylase
MDGYDPADNSAKSYDVAIISMRDKLASFRKEVIGECTLYLGDCREVLPLLPKVDAVVTSPPYAQQRDYGQPIDDWASIVGCLSELNSDGAQILVNLGLIHRDGCVVEYWDALKDRMRAAGWRLFGWYVWDKGYGAPGSWNGRLAPAHEFVFHFNKSAREVTKWVRTQDRMIAGTGLRLADGSMGGIKSAATVGQPFKVPDSVIRLPPHQLRGGPESEHPAVFPVGLPRHLITSFTHADETVLDPFMGSGTTGVAAAKLGRKFIGIDIEPKYFNIACRRIEEAYKQPDMFVQAPQPKAEQVDMLGLLGMGT